MQSRTPRGPGHKTLEFARHLREATEADDVTLTILTEEVPSSQLRLLPPNHALPRRADKLPERAASFLATRVAEEAFALACHEPRRSERFTAELTNARRTNLSRWFTRAEWSASASTFSRILRRGPGGFDAFIDLDAQRIVLAERSHGLPRAIADQFDPESSRRLLRELQGEVIDVTLHKSVLQDLERTIPTPALALLAHAGTRVNVVANAKEVDRAPRRLRKLFGEGLAAALSPRSPGAVGEYMMIAAELKMHARVDHSSGYPVGTARHELCHAIDHALGRGGRFRSEEPDFIVLFERTRRAAADEVHDGLVFPTPYSATNSQELFAEAAAIFLGRYYDVDGFPGGGADVVYTRQDLLRGNEPVYRFLENIFVEEIPKALEGITPFGPAINTVNRFLMANQRDKAQGRRARAFNRAWLLALRGHYTEDAADLREALELLRKIGAFPWSLLRATGDYEYVDELMSTVRARLREL